MESILAKLAVYNSADMLRHAKQSLLGCIPNIPISVLVIMTLGCLVVATLYSRTHMQNPNTATELASRGSYPLSNSPDFSTLRDYISDWVESSTISPSELYSIWLQALNVELTSFQDELYIFLHSIELKPKVTFQIIQADTMRSNEFDESFMRLDMHFPLLVLRCHLRNVGCDAEISTALRISNFSSKMKALITHNERDLISLNMHLFSEIDFSVCTDIPTVDVVVIKRILLKALLRARPLWKRQQNQAASLRSELFPSSESTHKQTKETNEVSTQASHSGASRNQASQVFHPWTAPNFPLRNAISVEGAQSAVSAVRLHNGKSLASGREFQETGDIFKIIEKPSDTSSSEGLKGTLETLNGGTSSSSEDPTTDAPVVLAYNARVRQSITAQQVPRKIGPRLVRSASYYGENSPFKLQNMEESSSNGAFEDSFLGKLVPTLPTSVSTEVRLADVPLPRDHTRKLAPSGYPGDSVDLGEQKTPQPEMNDLYQGEVIPVGEDSPFKPRLGEVTSTQATEVHGAGLNCKKLLIKVVKAEGLLLKGTSNAYCVVELDEPYQRHTTHCSSAGQLFWDQHLLFDLNTNSKRIALEVFELFKRKKSVSKGRSELLLHSLFAPSLPEVDADTESISTGIWDASQFRRCLPLISRADPVLTPGTNISGSSSPGMMATSTTVPTTSFNFAPGGIYQTPTITAEFHFMEKANEEALAARLRASGNQSSSVHRTCSARTGPQSVSAQDSPILGFSPIAVTASSTSLSHSTSLEFGTPSKFAPSLKPAAHLIAETEGIAEAPEPLDGSATLTRKSGAKCPPPLLDVKSNSGGSGAQVSPTIRTAQLFSPIPLRRAQLDHIVQQDIPSSPSLGHPRQKMVDKIVVDEVASKSGSEAAEGPRSPGRFEAPTGQHMFPSDAEPSIQSGGPCSSPKASSSDKLTQSRTGSKSSVTESLQRTDSLIKRSNILGADESKEPSQRVLLPFPDSDFDFTKDDSHLLISNVSTPARSQSLASRLKPSRLLGSGTLLRPGKRSSEDSFGSSTNSLALLGPSRQLAGVVAGLSSLPSESGTSPISAAALASAMAVAGATGSWQSGNKDTSGVDGSSSQRQSKSTEVEGKPGPLSGSHDTPLRYAPPAACIAAGSPGTYTPLSQPRRSDASNLNLFRLFRHKKKRFRSVGAEKLLYLESTDLEDLDALSTEGYYRIVQDTDPNEEAEHQQQHKQ